MLSTLNTQILHLLYQFGLNEIYCIFKAAHVHVGFNAFSVKLLSIVITFNENGIRFEKITYKYEATNLLK